MVREIKFKGYAVEKLIGSQWVNGFGVDKAMFTDGTSAVTLFTDGYPVIVHENSVGQYTGLKDKNGQEIYEGDIVNVVVRGGYRSGFEQFIKSVPVTYNEKLACFDPFGWCVMWCKDEKVISAEVIGNIYENPDLLKEG